jgi:hypothetical protein
MESEIQIRIVGGREEWINIPAWEIREEVYLVMEDEVYNEVKFGTLFEFYPGDIIIANSDIFPTDEFLQGVRLITPGLFPDRPFLNFLFKAETEQISRDENSMKKYNEEISRVRKEMLGGKSFYRGVRKIIESIDSRIKWAATNK